MLLRSHLKALWDQWSHHSEIGFCFVRFLLTQSHATIRCLSSQLVMYFILCNSKLTIVSLNNVMYISLFSEFFINILSLLAFSTRHKLRHTWEDRFQSIENMFIRLACGHFLFLNKNHKSLLILWEIYIMHPNTTPQSLHVCPQPCSLPPKS